MSFLLENWILIVVAFISGGMLVWPMVRGGGGGASVATSEAVRLINRERGVLVDVCEPHEYAAGHAVGARNIPFGQLGAGKGLPGDKTLPILLICASGARSGRAVSILRKAGYEKALSVAGGMNAWRDAQLPVERGDGSAKGDKSAKADKAEKSDKSARAAERSEKTPAA